MHVRLLLHLCAGGEVEYREAVVRYCGVVSDREIVLSHNVSRIRVFHPDGPVAEARSLQAAGYGAVVLGSNDDDRMVAHLSVDVWLRPQHGVLADVLETNNRKETLLGIGGRQEGWA